MKEYNETEAIALYECRAPRGAARRRRRVRGCSTSYTTTTRITATFDLDLEGDDEADINGMTAYISRFLRKNAPAVQFSDEHIAAMIAAEIEYENSLI